MGEAERASKPHSLSLSVNQIQASALDCWICARAKRHRDSVKSLICQISEILIQNLRYILHEPAFIPFFPLNLNGYGALFNDTASTTGLAFPSKYYKSEIFQFVAKELWIKWLQVADLQRGAMSSASSQHLLAATAGTPYRHQHAAETGLRKCLWSDLTCIWPQECCFCYPTDPLPHIYTWDRPSAPAQPRQQ